MNEGAHLRKALIFINKLTYYYITKNLINLLLNGIFHFYFQKIIIYHFFLSLENQFNQLI